MVNAGLLDVHKQMKELNIEVCACCECQGPINIYDDDFNICMIHGSLTCIKCLNNLGIQPLLREKLNMIIMRDDYFLCDDCLKDEND